MTVEVATYLPARVDEEFVLRKCAYFSKIGQWERRADIRPESWLDNFGGEKREYAVSLLNAFLYFNDDMMLELFRGAFHGLSRTLLASAGDRVAEWKEFTDRVIFTPVLAPEEEPAESGVEWLNRWKKDMRLGPEKAVWPDQAIRILLEEPTTPIVFLDDFVGSGRQMREMWDHERYVVQLGETHTFGEVAEANPDLELVYAPALCTSHGRGKLQDHCPQLYVNPGNEITPQHNVLAPDSVIWPEEHLAGGREFVEAASARAGIPADLQNGFEDLGLALGYGLSLPDAALPLIYWEENGWKPLMKRS